MQNEQPVRRRLQGVNIPAAERAITGLAGAALAALGVRHRGVLGGVMAGLGAALIARAAAGRSLAYRWRARRDGVDVYDSIVVRRSRHEVYAALRDLRRAPRFMSHVVSVVEHGATADWTAELGPMRLEWTSQITCELPDLRIAWRSLSGGDVEHVGVIDLEDAPDGPGTLVTIALRFEPPAGAFAGPLRRLFRLITRNQLGADLVRLRTLLEADTNTPRIAYPLPPFRPAGVSN